MMMDFLASVVSQLKPVDEDLATEVSNLEKMGSVDEVANALALIASRDPRVAEALLNADRVMSVNPTNRLPRLNPLVEAALVERLQFDGDAPELRSGPLPAGVAPAVPVAIQARNPIAIGHALREASAQVRRAIDSHEGQRVEAISTDVVDIMAKHGATLDVMKLGSSQTDLASYRRGEVPAPLPMAPPSGGVMAQLSKAEQRALTWGMITTTQGRRSVVPLLQEEIEKRLTKIGFQVTRGSSTSPPISAATWKIDIRGKENLHPGFSFVDVATAVISVGLVDNLADKTPRKVRLEVDAIHQISDRVVGWFAQMYEST